MPAAGIPPIGGLDPKTGQLPAPPMPPGMGGPPGAPGAPAPGAGTAPPAGSDTSPNGAPAPATATKMHTIGALRELDLIRRRLNKGGRLGRWVPEHLPGPLFDRLTADLADGDTTEAIAKARATVIELDRRQRRDQAVTTTERQVTDQLGRLAAGLTHGTVSPAGFVDDAVEVMRQAIRVGLAHGAAQIGRASCRERV